MCVSIRQCLPVRSFPSIWYRVYGRTVCIKCYSLGVVWTQIWENLGWRSQLFFRYSVDDFALYLKKFVLITWWREPNPRAYFSLLGREWSDWSSELRIPGDELKWKFISDGSVNGWGWRFTVYPIMPAAGKGGAWRHPSPDDSSKVDTQTIFI